MSDEEEALEDLQDTGSKEEQVVRRKSRGEVRREEREDFIHSLEHIVTVGSSNRRATQRAKEWERTTKEWDEKTQDELQSELSAEDKDEDGKRAAAPLQMMHAEDVRIYGKYDAERGYRPRSWPTKYQKLQSDTEWDNEHGDCSHPLAFLEARLSSAPPSKRQRVDGPNLSMDKTDCTVALEEVPRAMLVRCWERAVHAASTRIDCGSALSEEEAGMPDAASFEEDQTKYSVANAVTKCQDLNIHIKPGDGAQACPACGIMFESNEDLRKHFFGRSNQQRGCCWSKIRMTQYELLDQILQRPVTECAGGLMHIVMSSLDNPSHRAEAVKGSPPTQRWQDILRILELTCDSARVQGELADCTLETMQYEPHGGHITLNPHIIRNAEMRLIERYANMPR